MAKIRRFNRTVTERVGALDLRFDQEAARLLALRRRAAREDNRNGLRHIGCRRPRRGHGSGEGADDGLDINAEIELPLVVDLGYGASPVTTLELRDRLAAVRDELEGALARYKPTAKSRKPPR